MKKTVLPDTFEKALIKSRKICASKENSVNDIRHKLHDWGISETDSSRIIQNLLDEKFIDEQRYANAAVKDKFKFNKWGTYKIKQFLRQKGIPDPLINEALTSIDGVDNTEMLEKLLIAKLKTLKGGFSRENKFKLLRYAQSKGFESGVTMQIIEKLVHSGI
jgi:regulatory protein